MIIKKPSQQFKHKLKYLGLVGFLAFGGVGFMYVNTKPALAATTPDSCFEFSSGTITDYYDHEGNDSANPACPRDVSIPSTLGGVVVTEIGKQAFGAKQLTSVAIPDSVTTIGMAAFVLNELRSISLSEGLLSIGEQAFEQAFDKSQRVAVVLPNSIQSIGVMGFMNNNLSSINIPTSMTTINRLSFAANKLTSLTIPSSIQSVGERGFYINELTDVSISNSVTDIEHSAFALQGLDMDEFAVSNSFDGIWYTKLHTQNSANPNNLKDSMVFESTIWGGYDANSNGVDDALGGHVVDPASLTLDFRSSNDAELSQSVTLTGEVAGGDQLNDYLSKNSPTASKPDDPSNPTPQEQQAIDDALAVYYRVGEQVTITPPAIDGYRTPAPQTFSLSSPNATAELTYLTEEEALAAGDGATSEQPGGSDNMNSTEDSTDDSRLADTGESVWLIIAIATVNIALATCLIIWKRRSPQAHS